MSSGTEAYYIPKRLDEPERIIFWSTDEITAILIPFIILYFCLNLFIPAIIASSISCYWWKKFKGGEQANLHLYAIYWFYPAGLMGLKATPKSYIKTYFG